MTSISLFFLSRRLFDSHSGRRSWLLFAGLALLAVLPGCASTPSSPTPAYPALPGYSGPVSASLPAPYGIARTLHHEVAPSETLWRISKIYNVDMNTIMRANNLTDPTKISIGQTLIIPNTQGAVPVIPLYPSQKWSHIVIHHTATDTGNAISINEIHHKRGFWNGLGYHFLIDNGTDGKSDGNIEVGPRWIRQSDGAHANANGMNQHGIGISLVGNYSQDRVSAKSLDSLVFLVKTLQNYYRIPDSRVVRHKDVPGKHTECPGNYFPWEEFKARLH